MDKCEDAVIIMLRDHLKTPIDKCNMLLYKEICNYYNCGLKLCYFNRL